MSGEFTKKKIDFSYFAKPLLSKLRAAELGDQPKDSEQEIQGANYRISSANETKNFLLMCLETPTVAYFFHINTKLNQKCIFTI